MDQTIHEFSDGAAIVYCYRHTGERHVIEAKPVYDEGFYSGESSEEEGYSSDDEEQAQQLDYLGKVRISVFFLFSELKR